MKDEATSSANQKIGDTRLKRALALEKKYDFSSIFLKLEQDNPTYTHKDRAAFSIVKEAKKKGSKSVTIGTCGNFGVSVAYFCKKYNLNSHLFIPKNYEVPRLMEMKNLGAEVTFTKGTYEDAVDRSAEFAKISESYDANPHNEGARLAILSYKEIAKEIHRALGKSPTTVWVPVGNGTLLTGVYYGFSEIGDSPRLGAVSSKNNNAIIESYVKQTRVILKPGDLKETKVNGPLLNWRPTQFEESLTALNNTNGFAYGATDEQLINAKNILKSYENISTEPSSASALVGFINYKNKLPKSGIHVIVLTS